MKCKGLGYKSKYLDTDFNKMHGMTYKYIKINKHYDKAAPKYFAIKCTPSLASIFQGKGKFFHKNQAPHN